MAIEQVSLTIGSDLVRVSVGDCVIQALNPSRASVEFALSETQPDAGSQFFEVIIDEPTTIGSLGAGVWVRIRTPKATPGIMVSAQSVTIVVAREEVF